MGLETLLPGQNPQATAFFRLRRESDDALGVTMDTEGNVSFSGDVTVGGSIIGGNVSGGPSNPYGLGALTVPDLYAGINDQFPIGSGTHVLNLVSLAAGDYTHLGAWLQSAGTTSTGSNRLTLYLEDGTLIDVSNDMTTDFGSGSGWVEQPLSAGTYTHPGGNVYIGALSHFSVDPHLWASNNLTNVVTINGHRPTIYYTGQTSPPASINVGAANTNSAAYAMYIR